MLKDRERCGGARARKKIKNFFLSDAWATRIGMIKRYRFDLNFLELSYELLSESASALKADWLTIIHHSRPNQISISKNSLFPKYKFQIRITVFVVD